MEELETRRSLLRILEEPDKVPEHMRRLAGFQAYSSFTLKYMIFRLFFYQRTTYRTAGAIILKIAYGYNPALREKDALIDLAETAMSIFSQSATGGAWMVDIFPFSALIKSDVPTITYKII